MAQAITILSAIWSALQTIPATVWTALMGSGFTLLGVLFANRHSRDQLKTQLEADAAEKAKQRRADLRKAVYLESAEELVSANAVIGALPQTDLTKVNPGKELKSFFASMIKLQLVGDPKTARLANNLASSYGEVLGRTMTQVLPIRDAISNLEIQDTQYEVHQIEIKRILAEMTLKNESGKPDLEGFDAKSRSLEFHKMQAAKIESERQRLRTLHTSLLVEFMRSIGPTLKALMMELLPLMVELRRELDVGGDYEDFKEMLEAQARRMQGMIDGVATDIEPRL
jgi:hypothetical protein